MQQIIDRLERDPMGCGDPVYSVARLRLRVRHVSVDPVYVEYGVPDGRPLVWLRFVASFRRPAGEPDLG